MMISCWICDVGLEKISFKSTLSSRKLKSLKVFDNIKTYFVQQGIAQRDFIEILVSNILEK